MKNSIYSLVFLLSFIGMSFNANAKVWTVSNRADKPAQFTQMQPAIDAAQPGDTIIVAGSNTLYSDFTLNRRLIVFGEGFNNPNGQSTALGNWMTLANVNSGIGASGSKFYGIYFNNIYINGAFSGALDGENKLENILFDRCVIAGTSYGPYFGGNIYNNFTFKNCYFAYTLNIGSEQLTNIQITNCIFNRSDNYDIITSGNVNGQVFIKNCLFINRSTTSVFSATGLVIENCIFYGAQPTGASLSTFNNNLTYANSQNALPYGDNVGSGNIVNADPKFANFPVIGAALEWTHDFALQVGSPAIGTGTNGTNIGITGGSAPLEHTLIGNSKLPVVTQISVPVSSVPVGGTLQINVKANTRK